MVLLCIVGVLASMMLFSSCSTPHGEGYGQWQQIAKPYAFDFVSWQLQALVSLPREMLCQGSTTGQELELRSQIKTVLADEGISTFPPVVFRLENPPHLLVISLRDRIVYLDRKLLRQELNVEEMERIEAEIDRLGLSSLVVELGGFGATYPPIVSTQSELIDTIKTVVDEWLHQYLVFRPLGFLYLLDSIGIKRNTDIVTMNETLAWMVSQEIASEVQARYYKNKEEVKADRSTPQFDFDAEMRETRKTVDEYLAEGKIKEAERYMEERRKEFVAHGYYIRKLNQAYFAFYGIYAQDPASVSPVYADLKELRSKSPSLRHFLAQVAEMKSYNELREAIGARY